MNWKQKLNKIPKSPGVYIFHDKNGKIIYIGKAKILRNRIRSYFNKIDAKDSKTQVMVKNIVDIDWIILDSEVEALLTEANLIKEHKPRYNVFLKDDKTFPYIRITKEPFPRVEIIRQKNLTKDENNYFGPFTDAGHLREILRVMHKVFPLRTCTYFIDDDFIDQKKAQVCLDYHIKRCDGPCEGLVPIKEYNQMIEHIKRFLRGNDRAVRKHVKESMEHASMDQNYEDAARYRDQLTTILEFSSKQKKVSQDFKDRDVIVMSAENSYGIGVILRIRNGHILGREKFNLKVHDPDAHSFNLAQFFLQYYSSTIDLPEEILIEYSFIELAEYENWLTNIRKKKVRILIPERGEKRKMVAVSKRNADLLLAELRLKQAKRKELHTKSILRLQDDLGMEVPPRRIEAFDNSNIQGSYPVAGMVCYIDGKPRKSEYRKFHVKSVNGIDDFASMREVVKRRYSRQIVEKKNLPDLILIDGGKGQLSAAKSSLDALGLGYVHVIGLAKRLEEVFKPGISEPQTISKTSPGLRLLRKIRDEVHRYAISFHKKVRKEDMTKSIFEEISGMGESRIKKLWKTFDSIEQIQDSSINGIRKKTGFSKKICTAIKERSKDN